MNVAEGNDVLILQLLEIGSALAANADAGDVQLLAGWNLARSAQDMAGNDGDAGSRHGRSAEEVTARERWRLGS